MNILSPQILYIEKLVKLKSVPGGIRNKSFNPSPSGVNAFGMYKGMRGFIVTSLYRGQPSFVVIARRYVTGDTMGTVVGSNKDDDCSIPPGDQVKDRISSLNQV